MWRLVALACVAATQPAATPAPSTPAPSGSPTPSPSSTVWPTPWWWHPGVWTPEPTTELSKDIELQGGACEGREPFDDTSLCYGGITGGIPCPYGPSRASAAVCHDICEGMLGEPPAGIALREHYSTSHPLWCHCCCAPTCDCYDETEYSWTFASFSEDPTPVCSAATETPTTPAPTPSPTPSPTGSTGSPLAPTPYDWEYPWTREPTSDFSETIELRAGTCEGRDPMEDSSRCVGGIAGGIPCPYGHPSPASAARCHDACAEMLGEPPAGVALREHASSQVDDSCHCCCAPKCDCYEEETDDAPSPVSSRITTSVTLTTFAPLDDEILWWEPGWTFASFTADPTPICSEAETPSPTGSPEPAPTGSPTCVDKRVPLEGGGRGRWLFNGNPKKGCAWIGKRTHKRCKKADPRGFKASRYCCACKNCVDDEDWALATDASKGCDWVAMRPGRRCKKKDADGVRARTRCCACQ